MSSVSNDAQIALIALGSNLGDSLCTISDAVEILERYSRQPVLQSSFWRSSPIDCPPGSPDFVNASLVLWPFEKETPESLLEKLQELERHFGRKPKTVLNEPRPLDLDLIAFGQEVRATATLTLPHPRAHLRRFVTAPLAEIAPDFVLPGQGKTIRELDEALARSDGSVRRTPAAHRRA
jgi:2-amino-4-hydroxy-6-hydroxymethyldihydropteridine diphosphokinase